MRPRSVLWFVLGLALGLVLGMIVGYVTPALGLPRQPTANLATHGEAKQTSATLANPRQPTATTEATLNVRYTNAPGQIRADVREALAHASLVRLQELWTPVGRSEARSVIQGHIHWQGSWRTARTGLLVAWDTRTWRAAAPGRARLVHHGIEGLTPDRFLAWKLLRYLPTGQLVAVGNVHPVSGACVPSRSRIELRRQLARSYWRVVVSWTRRQLAAGRQVLLGGDLNCWLTRRSLAGRQLLPLYRPDRAPWYDHLLTAREPGAPASLRRWELPARSDHALNLRRLGM